MATHLAAICSAKGKRFIIESVPTLDPGRGELLIQVKSVAINPADGHMRNTGLMIPAYPAVIGFDIAGMVIEVGEDVPVIYQPGVTRVAAYATSVWKSCDPKYGAFQEKCLVPWQHAAHLPAEGLSWNQAATLPVAVQVALNAWDVLNIPRLGQVAKSRSSRSPREALLIWGGSSSVGTMGVQTGRLLREDSNNPFAAVYATASVTNHAYLRSLGADKVFDYKDPQVVDTIVVAAKEDDLAIRHCLLANGDLAPCQAVLKAFLTGADQGAPGKIASAPLLPSDTKSVAGIETIFVLPSMTNDEERLEQFQCWLGTCLRQNLATGTITPSPEPTVVGGGLDALNAGLDEVLKGVHCTKLVVEVMP